MLLRFDDYALDLRGAELCRGETPVPLEPQVFDLVAYMVQNAGRLVSRAELIEAVWHGRIVSDAAIDSRVHAARAAIGDDKRETRLLRTVRGRGLVFDGIVTRAEEKAPAAPRAPTAEAPPADAAGGRPSLAVLPFAKIGDDTRFAALGDALPHDLIAALSRLRWLFVIARASSFRFDARDDPVSVAGKLGVRYALAGALDTFAGRITVTVELFDAMRGGVIWADRMEGALDDIHRVRGEIVAAVVAALELRIPLEEAAHAATRPPEALDAWGAYHLGLRHVYRFTQRDNEAALGLFQRAIVLDPGFARAHAALSFAQFQNAFSNFAERFEADRAAAARTAERAIELDPLDPVAVHAYGRSRWLHGDLDGAESWLGRAISLNPNHAQSFYARALVDLLAGQTARINPGIDIAYSLSPFDPLRYGMYMCRAYAAIVSGDVATGVAWADRASGEPNANAAIKMMAAVANELAGHRDKAERQVAEAFEKSAHYSMADYFAALPFRDEATRAMIVGSFRRLGVR